MTSLTRLTVRIPNRTELEKWDQFRTDNGYTTRNKMILDAVRKFILGTDDEESDIVKGLRRQIVIIEEENNGFREKLLKTEKVNNNLKQEVRSLRYGKFDEAYKDIMSAVNDEFLQYLHKQNKVARKDMLNHLVEIFDDSRLGRIVGEVEKNHTDNGIIEVTNEGVIGWKGILQRII